MKKNNTGEGNSGNLNSGYWNSGNWNSGNLNSGYWNSGNWNSGNLNSGYWNSGNWNSGNLNSGYWNSGNLNSGNWNSGNLNSGNLNSGYCNTNEPPLRAFNIICDVTRTEYESTHGSMPIFPELTEWVDQKDMTAEEKKAHPEFGNTGGFLRTNDFKESFVKAWSAASAEQKKWFTDLPNFNPEIFFEITGVNVTTSTAPSLSGKKIKVEFEGKSYSATID